MRVKSLFMLLMFLAVAGQLSWAQETPPAEKAITDEEAAKLPYDMPMAGFEDSGTFRLFVNEEPLGAIDFRWDKDGRFANTFTMSMAGQTNTVETLVTPDEKGVWKKIEVKTAPGTMVLEREGRLIRRTFREQQAVFHLEEKSILFDNYGPALQALVIRQYDQARRGKQELSIYVSGAVILKAAIERQDDVERAIEGRDMKFARYLFTLHTVDITLLLDEAGRIVLESVPAQNAYFVRQGFEVLAAKPVDDPLLSKPDQKFSVQKNVMVPMRDKVTLATDLYLPETGAKAPCVLIRTPYGKDMAELSGKYWARRGYAAAVQDCRGRFKSRGVWTPFMHEATDGYDTIEWLAGQTWCSGKIGMIGGSYLGWVQWWAASLRPPHLTTIIPNVAPPDPHYNIPYEYGAFFQLGAIWWAKILESEATADISGKAMVEIGETDYSKVMNTLPVIDLDKLLLGKENPYWREWIRHPDRDAYWAPANFLDKLKNVNIPVFHQSGWFDGDGIGTKLNVLKMKEFGHKNQKVIVGPWGHTDTASRGYGEKDFGKDAVIDLQREYLRWFDFWLKGTANGVDREPLVRLFAMGSNRWLTGNTYPLEGTVPTRLYLSSEGKANTGKGDGKLMWQVEQLKTASDVYTYDPGNPTPDPDFYPTRSKEELKKTVLSEAEEKKKVKAYHRELTDTRSDILVYTTEPLDKPLTLCGPLSAVLYAASSARDTDWFVTLMEEDKDGQFFTLACGKIRARYRRSLAKPELLKPGEVVPYTLDLWHTGITIPAGSRLRVEVASAIFPVFSRNLNTGGHNETETRFVKAGQTIYHSARYPSHLLLPVIPEKEPAGENTPKGGK